MPFLSRLMIKLALLYLVAGVILGATMLINKAFVFHSGIWSLLPIHIEFLIFGWIIQLTLGVAYWMLPRLLEDKSRGNKTRAQWMVILFNVGIWMVTFSHYGLLPASVAFFGRIAEALAVLIFISLHWNRVVTYNR